MLLEFIFSGSLKKPSHYLLINFVLATGYISYKILWLNVQLGQLSCQILISHKPQTFELACFVYLTNQVIGISISSRKISNNVRNWRDLDIDSLSEIPIKPLSNRRKANWDFYRPGLSYLQVNKCPNSFLGEVMSTS